MIKEILVGIDDTDIIGSPGTGSISRKLALRLEELGLGKSMGITRHQLPIDPRIPYTTHNSSLCILMETESDVKDFVAPCVSFLSEIYVEGSDPGLCICDKKHVSQEMLAFGERASREVVLKEYALDIAAEENIVLKELGGTGEGIIGALAAVTLRGGGNNGRFIALEGIRDISGTVTAGEILDKTAVTSVRDEQGEELPREVLVDTGGWVRPSLVGGKPVFCVKIIANSTEGNLYRPVLKSKAKRKEEMACE